MSTTLTISFTTMETLTATVGNDPKNYFLEFSSKEEYLQKVQTWKSLYKALSQAIRHNKQRNKKLTSAQSIVQHRMNKAGKATNWWSLVKDNPNYAEYKRRVELATSGIDKTTMKEPYDPTFLLKIRGEMKVKSTKR
jgi:hypothetical protein